MHPLACVLLGLCVGQAPAVESFAFQPGAMQAWEGEGFYLTSGSARGPRKEWGICSSDAGCPSGKAQLARNFVVPANATHLHGKAFINLPKNVKADYRLDIVLMDESRHAIPKQILTRNGWAPTTGLQPRYKGEARDYVWDLTAQRGKTVRLVLRDLDDRPNSHIYATGFRLAFETTAAAPAIASSVVEESDFPRFMLGLERAHNLAGMARYDSKRFTAISNTRERFAAQHLRYAEVFYDLFFDHFKRKGFALQPPKERLMIAMFDTPKGFEAYLGRPMPSGITGVYHTPSNRLVLYDLAQNAYLLASRDEAKRRTDHANPHDRLRLGDTIERRYQDAANDANLSTTMHECAHLLSFNSGLIRRNGDVPVWLAEGLATYCEATDEGDWQSLGSPNPLRISDLRRAGGQYLTVQQLLNDGWLRSQAVLLGYAQSWALYRLMMQERPAALRAYFAAVASRQVPEYRLEDFRNAIGGDMAGFEARYRAYLDELVSRHPARGVR